MPTDTTPTGTEPPRRHFAPTLWLAVEPAGRSAGLFLPHECSRSACRRAHVLCRKFHVLCRKIHVHFRFLHVLYRRNGARCRNGNIPVRRDGNRPASAAGGCGRTANPRRGGYIVDGEKNERMRKPFRDSASVRSIVRKTYLSVFGGVKLLHVNGMLFGQALQY